MHLPETIERNLPLRQSGLGDITHRERQVPINSQPSNNESFLTNTRRKPTRLFKLIALKPPTVITFFLLQLPPFILDFIISTDFNFNLVLY